MGAKGLSASALPAPRHDPLTVLEVRRKHAIETCEIQALPRHQGSQTGDEVQRPQHHVGRAVSERLFVLVHDRQKDTFALPVDFRFLSQIDRILKAKFMGA